MVTIGQIDQEINDRFISLTDNVSKITFSMVWDSDCYDVATKTRDRCLQIIAHCQKQFVLKSDIEDISHKYFTELIAFLNKLPLDNSHFRSENSFRQNCRNDAIGQIKKITTLISEYNILLQKENDKVRELQNENEKLRETIRQMSQTQNPPVNPYLEPSAPPLPSPSQAQQKDNEYTDIQL